MLEDVAYFVIEPRHEISNNVVCATSKGSDQLRICAVCLESLLVAWIYYEYKATDRTSFGVSKLERKLHMHV